MASHEIWIDVHEGGEDLYDLCGAPAERLNLPAGSEATAVVHEHDDGDDLWHEATIQLTVTDDDDPADWDWPELLGFAPADVSVFVDGVQVA